MRRSASLYEIGDLRILHPWSQASSGILVASEPFQMLHGDASPEELGEAIVSSIRSARQGLEPPANWSKWDKPLLGAAGVKYWTTFARLARGILILEKEEGMELVPQESLGPKEGFQDTGLLRSRVPADSSARAIGKAVLASLAQARKWDPLKRVSDPRGTSKMRPRGQKLMIRRSLQCGTSRGVDTIDKVEIPIAKTILDAARLGLEEEPLLVSHRGSGEWSLLTSRRLIWFQSGILQRLRWNEIKGVQQPPAIAAQIIRGELRKDEVSDLEIFDGSNQKYTLNLNPGAGYYTVWSALVAFCGLVRDPDPILL